MADITAIIITKNEEKNLRGCIESIRDFAARIIVCDSGSADATCDIAREMGAEVCYHEFEYCARQFNWALDNSDIKTRWVMHIDADERMTPDVLRASEKIMNSDSARADETTGVAMEAEYVFLGRAIRHGITKKRKIIIFRYGIGRREDRRRDPHTLLSSGVSAEIKPKYIHHDFKDVDSYIKKYNWYATRELMDYVDFTRGASQEVRTDKRLMRVRRKKFGLYYRCPKFLRAWLWFMYNYVLKLGFLDGKEGFIYHFLECYWYRALVDAKILEYERTGVLPDKLTAIE